MAFSLKIYTDSGLTTELVGNIIATQNADGSTPPVQTQLFLGSVTAGMKFQADSDPGVDDIVVSIADAAPGNGHEPAEIKLATTSGGLAGATAGAALNLGVQLLSEVPNATEFWVEVDDATGTVGNSTELSLLTNLIVESAV